MTMRRVSKIEANGRYLTMLPVPAQWYSEVETGSMVACATADNFCARHLRTAIHSTVLYCGAPGT